jgi:hypothetical protein
MSAGSLVAGHSFSLVQSVILKTPAAL